MADDIHAACDSRILALESALSIAEGDAANAVVELVAERDRLRVVADAARDFMVATPLAMRERRDRLLAALAALDVSADIGGEP